MGNKVIKTGPNAIVAVTVTLTILVAGLTGCQTTTDGEPVTGYNPGNIAPDFSVRDTDGNPVSLASLAGRPLALNFWALDCVYCIEEMPFLEEAHRQEVTRDDGVTILTVNMKDSAEAIQNFFDSRGYGLDSLVDADLDMTRAYGVVNIPATFLIDADGIIRHVKRGPFISQGELQLNLDRIR